MKRFLAIAAILVFVYFALAFAAEMPPASAPISPRMTEMSTAGKVLGISETHLKIERTLRGKSETMEFVLEKPFSGIAVGDSVKVNYLEKEGRNILVRVTAAKMTAVPKGKQAPAKKVIPLAEQVKK